MAVQPQARVLKRAVKLQRAGPNIRITCIGLLHIWQYKDTITLLYQAHVSRESSTLQGMGISGGGDIVVVIVTLYPCRRIVKEDIWLGTTCHSNGHIIGLRHDNLLVILACPNSSTIANLSSSRHGNCRRSRGNAFLFSQEEAWVWCLVISTHLPEHSVAILMVVPQGIDTPWCLIRCRENTQVAIIRAQDVFLSPVAQNVALETWCSLRTIASLGVCKGEDGTFTIFIYTWIALFLIAACIPTVIVECLLQEVAIPIYTVVHVHTTTSVQSLVRNAANPTIRRGIRLIARELICHIGDNGTTNVTTSCPAIINLARCSITKVVTRLVLIAGKDFLTMVIWVEVSHVM